MKKRKYLRPEFLRELHSQTKYEKWLQGKAQSLIRRDRKWLQDTESTDKISIASYKQAIHQAVLNCASVDAYTGEALDWSLLGAYNNADASRGKRDYKQTFALLPTVDHVSRLGVADFKICAWRTNDAKNDLSLTEFVHLCRKIVEKNQ